MKKQHEVKSWPEFFTAVRSGLKTFELRKNDRNYQPGDILVLKEWEPNTAQFTGRECRRRIAYVMTGAGNVGVIEPMRGLSQGYAILGLMDTAQFESWKRSTSLDEHGQPKTEPDFNSLSGLAKYAVFE
jgi:Domain of unknown function (DUF3850)